MKTKPTKPIPVECHMLDILRKRKLEEELENVRCLICDRKGTYNIGGFDYRCNYFFNTYLPKVLAGAEWTGGII